MPEDLEVPKADVTEDALHALKKVGVTSLMSAVIPGVGAALGEFLCSFFRSPFEARSERWMHVLLKEFGALQESKVDVVDLEKNEIFLTAVLQATTVAMRTHQQEKIEALGNALSNVARSGAPDEARTHLFLSFVDRFSGLHLRLLALFDDPIRAAGFDKWEDMVAELMQPTDDPVWMAFSSSDYIKRAIPEFASEREICLRFMRDLKDEGLVAIDGEMLPGASIDIAFPQLAEPLGSYTTELGKSFLAFIRPQKP